MEKKKLKLKISEGSKKTINNIELAKSKANNSVIIEKKKLGVELEVHFQIQIIKKIKINPSLILQQNHLIFQSPLE